MLPSPFYDEFPADIGGDEVWLRAQSAAHEAHAAPAAPAAPSCSLLRRLADMWSNIRVTTPAPAWARPPAS
ncbi:hypothetical protein [Variovorax sp. RCC_210]|uniref:hypothetical protein n=1 Tax=Variovorax sp. RCC_210 TaxID=3239217 RepID=UPI0035245416